MSLCLSFSAGSFLHFIHDLSLDFVKLVPFVDLLFNIFGTESFHLKVDSTGLKTNENVEDIENIGLVSPAEELFTEVYLPSVLGARLQGDGAWQVQRNLKTQTQTFIVSIGGF